MVVVTDDTTRPELAETLGYVNRRAKRCQCIVGSGANPTPWDSAHALIDALLADWQDAPDGTRPPST